MNHNTSREELYKLVWSKPMTKVAKEFGISDRGLAKLCERHGIPVPPRGYWAKEAAGKHVKKPPLLRLGDDIVKSIQIFGTDPSAQQAKSALNKEEIFPPDVQRSIAQELLPEHKIVVPKTLSSPHNIVGAWIREEERRKELERNERNPMLRAIYADRVRNPEQKALEKRRRILLSALFKAIEHRGLKLKDKNEGYGYSVFHKEDSVGFTVYEYIKQYRRELTDADRQTGRYYRDDQKWTQVSEPTGTLRLEIRDAKGYWKQYLYEDKADLPLEAQLNDVMVGMIKALWKEKARRIVKEEERRLAWERQREREEREAAIKAENQRKKALSQRALSVKLHT